MGANVLKGRVRAVQTFIVRRCFTAGGKTWSVGDVFDWRGIGMDEKRVQQIWDKRNIAPVETMQAEAEDQKVKDARTAADNEKLAAIARNETLGAEPSPMPVETEDEKSEETETEDEPDASEGDIEL